jgi:hypothetical protein
MNKTKYLMVLSVWGMELSWLYACAAFIMMAAFNKSFPLSEGVTASGLAIVLTAFTRFSGWRVIQLIGIQLLGFAVIGLRLIYIYENSIHSFFSPYWLIEFLNQPKTWLQWLFLFMSFLWLLFFWIGGFKIVTHPKNLFFVRNRFDLGVGVFLAILIIELLIIVKSGIHLQGLMTEMLMLPFLIFGMLAFTLIRNSGHGQRYFVTGYRRVGTVLSFAATILLLGTGMVMLFLPHLTRAAEISFDIIKTTTAPLGPVLIKIILFIFGPRKDPFEAEQMPDEPFMPELPALIGGKESLFYHIFGWGLFSIFMLIIVALLLFIAWRLILWLLSIQPHQKKAIGPWNLLTDLVKRLGMVILSIKNKLAAWIKGPQTAVQLYTALVGWGHLSGLTQLACETPLEYGARLGNRFPLMKNEIHLLINTHSNMVYGSHANNLEMLSHARAALRRLRSPTHWPARLKSFFLP